MRIEWEGSSINLLIECALVVEDDGTSDNMTEEYSILIKKKKKKLWLMSSGESYNFPVSEEDRTEAFNKYTN